MEKVDKKKTRKYTEEFKKQAIELAEDLGSMTKAAKQLGVAHANLHNWKLKAQESKNLENKMAQTNAEEELKRLRKEVTDLKKVNYILKAAAAVFSRDHQV